MYKAVVLEEKFRKLKEMHSRTLNEYFQEGWEYVDSIAQSIGGDSESSSSNGSVIVILKKNE